MSDPRKPDDASQRAAKLPRISGVSDGGHEIDVPNTGRLLAVIGGLAVAVLILAVGLSQLFQKSSDAMLREQAGAFNVELAQQRADVKALLEDTAQYTDNPNLFRISIDRAVQVMLADPGRLAAAPAPSGWVHPDDRKSAR